MSRSGEQRSQLLPNFPVHVPIRIFSDSQGYLADIYASWTDWYRFRIGLKPSDVDDLNAELQRSLQDVSSNFEVDGICGEALTKLAHIGNFVFKSIFGDRKLRESLNKVLNAGATIQVASEDFFIPWELLYDSDYPPTTRVNVSRFWGMQYIVSRTPIRETSATDLAPPIIQASCPIVGLIACNELEYVVGREIPALQKLNEDKQILLVPLRPLKAPQRNEELEYLRRFLSTEKLQIIHLACHAFQQKPLSESYLLVSDDFSITIKDFRVHGFKIKHSPFVILNACLTGTFSPLHALNWANVFKECGARGILATEFHVPDSFAATFVEEFYKHFLAGKPIGEAVLATRCSLWQRQKNPLGLAYALYSSPTIRIAKTK